MASIAPNQVFLRQHALLKQLQLSLGSPDASSKVFNDKTRNQALAAAKELVTTLELPTDVVMRYAWEVT